MGQALCEGVSSFALLPNHSSWPTPRDQPMLPLGGQEAAELLLAQWRT